MKDLYIREFTDKYLQENFVRIRDILRQFDDEFTLNQAPSYTTVVRDTLRPKKGQVIFNETSGKFQGYNGSAWVDFN